MRKFIFIIAAFVCLASCSNNDDEGTKTWSPWVKSSRSIMIYMAGDNNLTNYNGYRYLNNDWQEIIWGSKYLKDDQRLFVFVDSLGSSSKPAKAAILEVHGGEVFTRYEYSDDLYSCNPAEFRKVVQWMTDNAQADSYGLVLWGHANGWFVSNDSIAESATANTRAYGQDTGEGLMQGERWMNITQLAHALQGLPKMAFIFCDCCNMICAEVGYELRNVTNYIIGSPAEIPGDGAPYDEVVPQLFKNDRELYCGIIDTYYDYYLDYFSTDYLLQSNSLPLSVIDTKYIELLAQATRQALDSFEDGYPEFPYFPSLDKIGFYLYYDYPIMYDMKAFLKTYASADAYAAWESAYNLAVPYHRMSMKWQTIYSDLKYAFSSFPQDESLYGCISMFIPMNTKGYYNGRFHYNTTCHKLEWNSVIDWKRFGWNENSTYSPPL